RRLRADLLSPDHRSFGAARHRGRVLDQRQFPRPHDRAHRSAPSRPSHGRFRWLRWRRDGKFRRGGLLLHGPLPVGSSHTRKPGTGGLPALARDAGSVARDYLQGISMTISREDQVLERIAKVRKRRPRLKEEVVTLAHGAGGKSSAALVDSVFLDAFR